MIALELYSVFNSTGIVIAIISTKDVLKTGKDYYTIVDRLLPNDKDSTRTFYA